MTAPAAPAESSSSDAGLVFRPLDPEQLVDPYPFYTLARDEQPVFYSADFDSWIVTRYDDIVRVTQDAKRYSSANSIAGGALPPDIQAILAQGYERVPNLIDTDPPEHTRMHTVIRKAFTPQRIAVLEPQIRAIATGLIDSFAQDGKADLMERFAFPLPGLVMCDLLGVPREDLPQIKRWSDDWMATISLTDTHERLVEAAHGFVAFQKYIAAQLEDRSRAPREDLLSVLVPESLGGSAPISLEEAIAMSIAVLGAGHETTTHLLLNMMQALIRHPDQLQLVRERPELIPNVIEETLRYESPSRCIFRTTAAEVELGGVTLPPGTRLILIWPSGNRDERRFPEPDRFDITRRDAAQHLGFGRGVHFCIGAALARLEGRIALELLLDRLPNPRLQPGTKLEYWPNLFMRGYRQLPLEWDVAPA
ncbi:MAG TPA: cytochrome P450 [Herpetosiphonaceae bacterium]